MTEATPNNGSPVAAVDLGSNSFHMVIGRMLGDQLSVLDRLRDPVRLAAGIDERGELDEETVERMCRSLEIFRQRLGKLAPERVRAIGTNTFRRARRQRWLLDRASEALGHPIGILSGPEEARLIYLGVTHDQGPLEGNRLVVDIGGGSTECILGRGFRPSSMDSLYMGCVSYTMRFFPDGRLTRAAFGRAETAARLELEPIKESLRRQGWEDCVGSSGTIRSVGSTLQALGWSDGPITLAGIKKLRKEMVAVGEVGALELPAVKSDRVAVLPGGLSILKAIFEDLQVGQMRTTRAALREGVLYDLLGRIRHEDVRDRTIRSLSARYHVDDDQAARVERTAVQCLEQVCSAWSLEREVCGRMLSWAARTHEIGLALSYSGYHRHSAYILANSVMPGFSHGEQERLALLVRGHRRKILHESFEPVAARWQESLLYLSVLLRLAVRLNRTRSPEPGPCPQLTATRHRLQVSFPDAWLEEHPLTRADLEEEAGFLRAVDIELVVP